MLSIIDSFRKEANAMGVDCNSIEEFSYWIESSLNKHAWIEPLKSDQSSEESWIKKEHPELFAGRHPLYCYSDDEMQEHGIILIGSTPITHNYVKNFKLNFNDQHEEKDQQGE